MSDPVTPDTAMVTGAGGQMLPAIRSLSAALADQTGQTQYATCLPSETLAQRNFLLSIVGRKPAQPLSVVNTPIRILGWVYAPFSFAEEDGEHKHVRQVCLVTDQLALIGSGGETWLRAVQALTSVCGEGPWLEDPLTIRVCTEDYSKGKRGYRIELGDKPSTDNPFAIKKEVKRGK